LAGIVAALTVFCDAQTAHEQTTEAMMLTAIDKCPCIPIIVCPHVYGSNPEVSIIFQAFPSPIQ
jgi:hypothetical protein